MRASFGSGNETGEYGPVAGTFGEGANQFASLKMPFAL